MRLVSWNVNSLNVRMPRLLEFLELHEPDVVCLQETKVTDAAFPAAELRLAGYSSLHHSAGRWAGVALLARDGLDVQSPERGLQGESVPEEARWIQAKIAGLEIASVYVPNGRAVGTEAWEQKLTFLDAIVSRAGKLDAVLGDFNVAPADLDVYDPAAFAGSTHVTPQERSRIAALATVGLIDAYRACHPEDVGYTWWDYRQGHFHRGMGLRIDLALVASALLPQVRSCGIDRNFRKGPKPSDHAPLLLELAS